MHPTWRSAWSGSDSHPTNPLGLRREHLGLSVDDVVSRIESVKNFYGYRLSFVDRATVSAHEAGHLYPDAEYQEVYAIIYSASKSDLGFALDESRPGDHGMVHLVDRQPVSSVDHESDSPRFQEKLAMALNRATRFGALAGVTNVSAELMEEIYEETQRAAHSFSNTPAASMIPDLVELQEVQFRLLEGRQRVSQTRDLYLMAGIVSALLAEACEDLGNLYAARVHARTAYMCADNADHNPLRSYARFQQMNAAYWSGSVSDVLRYYEMSEPLLESGRGTAIVRLHAQSARAWATLGNAEASEASILRTHDARDHVQFDELDAIGGTLTYPRPRQLYCIADATLWLADGSERAANAAQAAIDAYRQAPPEEYSYVNDYLSRVDLALARIRMTDLEAAQDALADVLELPPHRRVASLRSSAARVQTALRSSRFVGQGLARDMREQIESFTRIGSDAGYLTSPSNE